MISETDEHVNKHQFNGTFSIFYYSNLSCSSKLFDQKSSWNSFDFMELIEITITRYNRKKEWQIIFKKCDVSEDQISCHSN